MRFRHPAALLLVVLSGCTQRAPQQASVLPPDSQIAPVLVLLTNDKTSQSPVLGYDDSVFFSHGKNIRVVTPNGRHRLWVYEPGPCGHRILSDRSHLVCDSGRGAILRLDYLAHRTETLSSAEDGQRLKRPSELTLDQWDGFFFTDAGEPQTQTGAVYYATPSHSIRRVVSDLALPTALALSSGNAALYVLENGRDRVLRFPVEGQGTLGAMAVFAELPGSDSFEDQENAGGLCFDASGNLYVAYPRMRDVLVLDPGGQRIRRYRIGNPTSGLCFGGPNLDQLYVTVCDPGALMRLNLGVRGVDLRPSR